MIRNESGSHMVPDQVRAGNLPDEREQHGLPIIERLIAEGCRQEVNGTLTRVIGQGEGLVIRETVLRPRFLQGV